MTDKEKLESLLEEANIEYDVWNDRMITTDNEGVEFHFDPDGNLTDIVGAS